jgi:hypothetical protein
VIIDAVAASETVSDSDDREQAERINTIIAMAHMDFIVSSSINIYSLETAAY